VVSIKLDLEYTRCIPKVIREVKDERNVYSEEWKHSIPLSSSFFFWKVDYLLKVTYLNLNNCIDFFYYMAIYSSCGLKRAFYSNSFNASFKVN